MSQGVSEESSDAGSCQKQSSSTSLKGRPLPWWCIVAACMGNVAHFYSICSLFSYAGIMSADLGWAADRDHAGNIAGFLQTANVLGRIPTSSFWGYFANRYGLKCGLYLAMASLALGNFLFGLCTDSVIVSIMIRFVFLGMGSGWTAFLGPLCLKIGGPERQTEVIGKLFGAGTFIQLIGPAVAGWTYGMVARFPAFMPGLLGALIGLAGLVAFWRWMDLSEDDSGVQEAAKSSDLRVTEVVCTWPLPLLILLRTMQGCMNFSFFEVVPLWAISSVELGGLEMSEDALGVVLSISGAGSALFMAFVLSRITSRFGLRTSIAMAAAVISIGFLIIPIHPGYVTLTIVHMAVNSSFAVMAAGYVSGLNNATPDHWRITVNGFCVTIESIGKAAGPLVSSLCFAGALSSFGRAGHFIVFFCLSCFHLLLALGTLLLPASINDVSSSQCSMVPSTSIPPPITVGAEASEDIADDFSDLLVHETIKDVKTADASLVECIAEQDEDEEDGLVDAQDRVVDKAGNLKKGKKTKKKSVGLELEPLKLKIEG